MNLRLCIACGSEFLAADPNLALCPECIGLKYVDSSPVVELTQPRVPSLPVRHEKADNINVKVSGWRDGDTILNTYEVRGELGQGGFGKVYRVHHKSWNIDLAVKRPLKLGDAYKQPFIDEAEKWVDLGLHPNIISCYYVRTIDDIPHTFAELAEGGSLEKWIESGKLYAGEKVAVQERTLDIAIQFAWGLGYAHEQGLVHQDVKPANVLMTPDGIAKVSDFGLAKARAAAGEAAAPESERSILISSGGYTPAYCSPEQARGEKLSLKTDIWSWAVSLLEMFSGGVTWLSGVAAAEALESYLEIGGIEANIPVMPVSLAELLRECFQRQPQQRPVDMFAIADRLQAIYQKETGQAYPRRAPKAAELRADSLNNKALSLLDLDQSEKALSAWAAALEADPLHPKVTYNQGLVLWRSGKLTDENLLMKMHSAGAAHPENWEYPYLSVLVDLERGDGPSAKETLNNLQGSNTNQAEVKAALDLANHRDFNEKFISHTSFPCTDYVSSICLSTDGQYVLSGHTKTVRLWEVKSGRCLRIFEGHNNYVTTVCLSADGRYALSGSNDHLLKLWELASGNCLRTFNGHKANVTSVCLSADGRYALSGSEKNTLKLWDVESGLCLRTFEGHTRYVKSVCLSADGRYALSGSMDNTLKLWEIESGRCLRTFGGHTDTVKSVCLSADGRFALSGSLDWTLKLWEVESGRCLRTFEGHKFFVQSVCLSADGRYALSCSVDSTLRLWAVESGRCLRTFEVSKFGVDAVCLSADGFFALSVDLRVISMWKVHLGNSPLEAPFMFSQVNAVHQVLSNQAIFEQALTQAQQALEDGGAVQAARRIRVARSQPGFERAALALNLWGRLLIHLPRKSFSGAWNIGAFTGHSDHVNVVCLSADARYALSGSRDHTLKLWEMPGGYCLNTFKGHSNYVSSVCLSADGHYALSGSYDHTLKLWEMSSGRCVHTFKGHLSWVNAVSMSVDGRYAVSGSSDQTLKLWEVESGRTLRTFQPNRYSIKSVCLSADGSYILADNGYEILKLWKVSNGRCIRTFKEIRSNCSTCLSGDGRYAMTASGSVRLWEIATGSCLRTFKLADSMDSISMSADGHYALSGSHKGMLNLLDVESGRCLLTLEAHAGEVKSVCLSTDGRYALSGGEDKTLKLWELDWELEEKEPADWDEGARPYLEIFLTQHTPYAGALSPDRVPTEEEITLALTRRGMPTWTEADFRQFLYTLGCAGFGWLRPEGVRRELEKMAIER